MLENSFDNSKNEKKKNINENKKDNFILENSFNNNNDLIKNKDFLVKIKNNNLIIDLNETKNNGKGKKSIEISKAQEVKKQKYYLVFDGKTKEDLPFIECYHHCNLKYIREKFLSEYNNYSFLYDNFPHYDENGIVSEITKKIKYILKRRKIKI